MPPLWACCGDSLRRSLSRIVVGYISPIMKLWVLTCVVVFTFFSGHAQDQRIITFDENGRCCSVGYRTQGSMYFIHDDDGVGIGITRPVYNERVSKRAGFTVYSLWIAAYIVPHSPASKRNVLFDPSKIVAVTSDGANPEFIDLISDQRFARFWNDNYTLTNQTGKQTLDGEGAQGLVYLRERDRPPSKSQVPLITSVDVVFSHAIFRFSWPTTSRQH